ncbi:E3 ubiquitin-protein ligase TRAIP-like [Condylostylus longicornis]|uniref:E3 ubiquitin-protein ligase TRAIP-like n=1 Tax=Condylostylus longicornis TaxID=2530218 RepID=UPI00244DF74A|nr:E3 ubiquitin-protein ligase TRAIP-like [Condylostylus longicornis]
MDINCPICSDNFNVVADVRSTLCGHVFHYDCITSWLERSSSCPQCRKQVAVFNLHRIFLNFENENEYHHNRECDAENLRKHLETLQLENDSLRNENRTITENFEELQVINMSLEEMKENAPNLDAEQLNKQLQYALGQNLVLETDLIVCKNELAEMKMKNLTLTEETLPSAKKLIDSLQKQLEKLSVMGLSSESDESVISRENSIEGVNRADITNLHDVGCRSEKSQFRKRINNLKKSTFFKHNRNATNSDVDLLHGLDAEDEEKAFENLIKHIRIQEET